MRQYTANMSMTNKIQLKIEQTIVGPRWHLIHLKQSETFCRMGKTGTDDEIFRRFSEE